MMMMCLYDRSEDEGLVSVERFANPSLVSDDRVSVVCLSRTEVDARSTCVLSADLHGHLQHFMCLPVSLHVYRGTVTVEFLLTNVMGRLLMYESKRKRE